jgi:hypothetical protein
MGSVRLFGGMLLILLGRVTTLSKLQVFPYPFKAAGLSSTWTRLRRELCFWGKRVDFGSQG